MANPVWFDEKHFAGQKMLQAQAMGQTVSGDVDPVTWLSDQITAWNNNPANADKQVADAYANFEACNAFPKYDTTVVARDQVNVSPNPLFNVAYYLSSAADSANARDYSAGGVAAGSWTAEAVLKHMYNDNGYTAWEHFKSAGIEQELDCSEQFSTSKYIDLKAAESGKTREVVKQELLASGLNPIEDFYESGMDKVITDMTQLQPDKAPAAAILTDSEVWVDSVTPPVPVDVDPYEVDVTPVAIEAGNDGPYTSEDGVNTRFDAVWVDTMGESTLAATDVINAGEAFNTLAIELGKDWKGFDNSALGKGVDNVTGVGRIMLNRQEAGSERHLSFDATNISEDAVRFDINAKGTGSTDLKNLSDAVNEVNLSGLKVQDVGSGSGKIQATSLNFVKGAKDGTADTLTIGLTDVGAAATPEEVTWNAGIETVIVNSKARSIAGQNAVDIYKATGVKEVDVTGDAAVTVRTNADSVTKYDMSDAKGQVNLNVYNLTNQTVTGGQHAEDGVTLLNGGNVTASKWTGVENVTFGAGASDSIIFNAADSQGIEAYWIAGTGAYRAINVADDDLIVYQTKGAYNTGNTTIINGAMNNGDSSLNNVTWQSKTGWTVSEQKEKGGVKAMFESNADGTATIKLDGTDYLKAKSSFEFANASKVVIDSQNDNTDFDGDATGTPKNIIFAAPKATEMTVDWTGSGIFSAKDALALDSAALGKLESLTLNLEDAGPTATPDTFCFWHYNLVSAQNVTVNGGGENVRIGALGTATGNNATPDLTLNATNVADFQVGDMGVGLGYNVDANISASGDVKLRSITSTTNAQSNDQGDVNLTVSGKSVQRWDSSGNIDITGGELNIDFSGVTGDVGVGTGLGAYPVVLDAMEGINYTGAAGGDTLHVKSVGASGYSTINTGGGSDSVSFLANSLVDGSAVTVNLGSGADALSIAANAVVTKGVATVNVICGEGADAIALAGASTGGKRIVNVEGFDNAGGDTIAGISGVATGGAGGGAVTAAAINSGFDLNIGSNGEVRPVDSNWGYYVDGNLYVVDSGTDTLVVLHGVDDNASFSIS